MSKAATAFLTIFILSLGIGSIGYGADTPFTLANWINVGDPVTKMICDPTQHYVYAVSSSANRLYRIDTQAGVIDRNIFIGSMPTDLAIDTQTNRLYVATFGATEIGVVDLATFTRQNPLIVASSPYEIEVGRPGRLYYVGEDQWQYGHVVDTLAGTELTQYKFGHDYEGDIEITADGSKLYRANSALSSAAMTVFNTSQEPVARIDGTADYEYPGSNAQRNLYLTKDEQYLIYKNFLVDANNVHHILGTYGESVYLASQNADYVFGSSKIWNGKEFTALQTLPFTSTVMSLSGDETWFFAYDSGSRRIARFGTPIPEPSSVVYVALGMMGTMKLLRKRRR